MIYAALEGDGQTLTQTLTPPPRRPIQVGGKRVKSFACILSRGYRMRQAQLFICLCLFVCLFFCLFVSVCMVTAMRRMCIWPRGLWDRTSAAVCLLVPPCPLHQPAIHYPRISPNNTPTQTQKQGHLRKCANSCTLREANCELPSVILNCIDHVVVIWSYCCDTVALVWVKI